MAAYTDDPVMGLIIPTPGEDPGEDYAVHVSDDLTRIAQHTHTGAANLDGYQVPTAGLNINEDLSMQGNNLIDVRTVRFIDQDSDPVGNDDVDCPYFKDGDLWINNGAGVHVQITSGSLVHVVTENNYQVLEVTVNHTINAADVDILFSCNSTAGDIIITLPLAADVDAGRFYFVKDTFGLSESNSITVAAAGGDTIDNAANFVIEDNYLAVGVVGDGAGNWMLFKYDRKIFAEQAIIEYNDGGTISFSNNTGEIFFNDGGTINMHSNSDFIMDHEGTILNPGITKLTGMVALGYKDISFSDSPYTIPAAASATSRTVITVDVSGGAVTINLPSLASTLDGRIIVIKDLGLATTNNITVVPNGGDYIEGLNASKIIQTNHGELSLIAVGGIIWLMI